MLMMSIPSPATIAAAYMLLTLQPLQLPGTGLLLNVSHGHMTHLSSLLPALVLVLVLVLSFVKQTENSKAVPKNAVQCRLRPGVYDAC